MTARDDHTTAKQTLPPFAWSVFCVKNPTSVGAAGLTDPLPWSQALSRQLAAVNDKVNKQRGKYVARSGKVKTLEGAPLDTSLIAIMAFPSTEHAEAFVADPSYAPYAAARKGGSESRFQLIDDTDAAGTISYRTKA